MSGKAFFVMIVDLIVIVNLRFGIQAVIMFWCLSVLDLIISIDNSKFKV